MGRYLLRRVGHAIVTFFFASVIIFGLVRFAGDPTEVLLEPFAPQEQVDRIRREWGLDQPLLNQYLSYMRNVLQGNFGDSLNWRGQSAGEVVVDRVPASLQLGGFAIILTALVGVPLGVVAAVKRGTYIDRFARYLALLGQSVPNFWIGIVLIWILAVQVDVLPTSGSGSFSHMILPGLTLALLPIAGLTRLLRSSMLEQLEGEYVKLTRVKGVPQWKVVWVHCLRNASLAPITYFGVFVGAAITGSIVIETVFSWPGIGQLSIQAVSSRDYPVVQTVVLLLTATYVVIMLVVDLLYGVLDPRIRLVSK